MGKNNAWIGLKGMFRKVCQKFKLVKKIRFKFWLDVVNLLEQGFVFYPEAIGLGHLANLPVQGFHGVRDADQTAGDVLQR